eukprot:CFRG3317T1
MTPAPKMRWTVAITFPRNIQEDIESIVRDITHRYQTHTSRAPPHITLIPPFERQLSDIDCVRTALDVFMKKRTSIGVRLNNFNTFPPRVVFIDVKKTTELVELKQTLEAYLLMSCDVPKDRHPQFNPHVTVASRDLCNVKFNEMWAELRQKEFIREWDSNCVTLMRYENHSWKTDSIFSVVKEDN